MSCAPAYAQDEGQRVVRVTAPCYPRADLLGELETRHGEHVAAAGRGQKETIVELTLSDAGDFSVIVTFRDGFACIVAAGMGWRGKAASEPGRGM